MSWITDPYRTDFMRHAAAMAVVVGVLAPVVGVWVVLRRVAYLGDAMSHGTLAGVAGAYLAGVSVVIGALVAGVAMGLLVVVFDHRHRIGVDSAIGVAETLMFALGIILISRQDGIGVELTHYLFGQIVTTSSHELVVNVALALVALALVGLTFADLRAVTFDPAHARQVGIPVGTLQIVLVLLISITVVVSLSTVGLLMSVAMLITPAAAARLVTNRVETMTAVAVIIGVTSALGGLTASYHLATPPGPTIALATVAWFSCCAVAGGVRTRALRGCDCRSRGLSGDVGTAQRQQDPGQEHGLGEPVDHPGADGLHDTERFRADPASCWPAAG
jgi:ABC-type Mn2+/Zn2+ transport system permease subunit